MTDKATPRPWIIQGELTRRSLKGGDGKTIVVIERWTKEDDAALIVRAVNAHDQLVEALTAIRPYVADALNQTGDADCAADLERIDAALRAAGVTP